MLMAAGGWKEGGWVATQRQAASALVKARSITCVLYGEGVLFLGSLLIGISTDTNNDCRIIFLGLNYNNLNWYCIRLTHYFYSLRGLYPVERDWIHFAFFIDKRLLLMYTSNLKQLKQNRRIEILRRLIFKKII